MKAYQRPFLGGENSRSDAPRGRGPSEASRSPSRAPAARPSAPPAAPGERPRRRPVRSRKALSRDPSRDLIGRVSQIFQIFPDFLGRLQPSKTTIRKTLGTPGVELSGYPRKVLHCYTSSSTRGQMRAELWLPPLCVWLSLILSLSIVRECLSLLPPCLHSLSLSLGRSSHLTPRKPLLLHSTPRAVERYHQ